MEILNIKVEKETKEKIQWFVEARGYKNKSDALRNMIEEHLEEHPELFAAEDMAEIIKDAERISDREFDRLAAEIFKGTKTAVELIAEGRER